MNIKSILRMLVFFMTLSILAIGVAETTDSKHDLYASKIVDISDFQAEYFKVNKLKSVIDPRVKGKLHLYGIDVKNTNYNTVLQILSIHGYVAVKNNEVISILPDVYAKQSAIPIVQKDGKYLEFETVTEVIKLKYANVGNIVPILRPLLPQRGHLAAHPPSNQIIITGTYSNLQRLKKIVSALDIKNQKIIIKK